MNRASVSILALGIAVLAIAPVILATPARADNGIQFVAMPPISKRTDFYGGAVIPLKFQLFDSNGKTISDATATVWVNGEPGTSSGHANMGNMFRYDVKAEMYIYNLNTKPLPAGPGSAPSTITINVVVGSTTLMENFVVSLD